MSAANGTSGPRRSRTSRPPILRLENLTMLTAEGCRQRRLSFWQKLDPPPESDFLLLCDPIHLMYLANFWVDPISLGAGFPGYLLLRKDGHAKLLHDNRLPHSVESVHVEERRAIPW